MSLSDAVLDFADAPKFHFAAGSDSSEIHKTVRILSGLL